jgi:hypothetical protein
MRVMKADSVIPSLLASSRNRSMNAGWARKSIRPLLLPDLFFFFMENLQNTLDSSGIVCTIS